MPDLSIEFQVDTGFSDALTLPLDVVERLRLPFLEPVRIVLADGSRAEMSLHQATIIWDGREMKVPVLATGRRPLLGTALLEGHELRVRYAEGDRVTVEAL